MFDNGVKKTMDRLRLDACIEPSDDSYPYAAERKGEKLDVAASSPRPDGLVQTGQGRQGKAVLCTLRLSCIARRGRCLVADSIKLGAAQSPYQTGRWECPFF